MGDRSPYAPADNCSQGIFFYELHECTLMRRSGCGIIFVMSGFTKEQKKELREELGVFGKTVDAKFESLARMVQEGFAQTATRQEMRDEFEKVHERLIKLDDGVSYSSQSFSLLTRDMEETKKRLARVEEHLGIDS